MNGERQIEILKPFREAWELMKRILFHPFDLKKWFVIGFAAFLASLSSGGFNFNVGGFDRDRDWRWRFSSVRHDMAQTAASLPGWVIPLIVVLVVMALAVVVVLMWVGARGRFMFVDCIVHNRGAIKEPWRQFRAEGNSFFVFSLLTILFFLIVAAIMLTPVFLPMLLHRGPMFSKTFMIVWLIGFATLVVLLAVGWHWISHLMVPLMCRRRCGAAAAFRDVIALIVDEPGPLILYFLFLILLGVVFILIGCAATCLTCCVAAIPYVGTVILLPLHVLVYAFTLLFLRQFGNEFDVWNGASPSERPPPPPLPPLQA